VAPVTDSSVDRTEDDGTPLRSDPALLGVVPGSMIHQYEIIRELGRGGMGRVLLARDTRLGRRVAIKFLMQATRTQAARFLAEARTTAQLSHENIVVIYEIGEHAGVPFIALEYLEGEPLTTLVSRGGVPWGRAIELMVPVVRALVRAHEHGVVHRDMKHDNVVLTRDGVVKVLDFGIAKALGAPERAPSVTSFARADTNLTNDGALVGTLPYMSPEQLGMDSVDERSDIWAVGVMLWELITGRHPLGSTELADLMVSAAELDMPLPSISTVVSNLPELLEQTIDGCLAKRKHARIATAHELLARLEPLLPTRSRHRAEDASPYVGLAAFQEADAGRFFGRSHEITRVAARIRERPLVAVVGPSGVGKSSFLRAGVIPALKGSSERWETLTLRPGRDPIAALATLVQPLSTTGRTAAAEHPQLRDRLRTEPGHLGVLLRERARTKQENILLFVDQFEELYTLVDDRTERRAFAACLAGVADDSAAPLRVVVSMRADFLDRVAESERLVDELTRGLVFLAPPSRDGLREALTEPLEQTGYRFESPEIVDDMLAALHSTPGALPLLQFVASRLWESRDRRGKLVTLAAYRAMGGISGALAGHADDAISQLSPEAQRFARLAFQRLVTPERTRAIVDAADLLALAPSREDGQRVLEQLVSARLLIVQARGDADQAVEIVHESLITGWPRLRRWLDESQTDAALLAQLQITAKQWDAAGRPPGLLWRGEAAEQARRLHAHASLSDREQAYLTAVIRHATRSTRIKRLAIGSVIAVLAALVIAAFTVIAMIRGAERTAQIEADNARHQAAVAAEQSERAGQAAARATKAQQESDARLAALKQAGAEVAQGKEDLRDTNAKLIEATRAAERARQVAEEAKRKTEQANAELKRINAAQEAELNKLRKANRPF